MSGSSYGVGLVYWALTPQQQAGGLSRRCTIVTILMHEALITILMPHKNKGIFTDEEISSHISQSQETLRRTQSHHCQSSSWNNSVITTGKYREDEKRPE